jgi:hypothetical protein
MLTASKTTRLALIMLSLGLVAGSTTFADAGFRRDEVNARLAHEKVLIDRAFRQGKISSAKANTLREDVKDIRQQERLDASFNHNHITPAEQKALNQLENGLRKKIP